jgi:hypothetical protein
MLDGPGYENINLVVLKGLSAGPTVRLELRAEVFNLLNHTNLAFPDAFLGSPTFGQVLAAGSPRRVQFGVRARF